ncbi:MAG: hypothetical protein H3Z53_00695 [archaeon]|nr:hypothetical protein [archaeon]
MKKVKSIDVDVDYYILRFQDGEPIRETTRKKFTVKEGERAEIPCPYCKKHIEFEVKIKAR